MHRSAGKVFLVTMLIMAGLGAYGALYVPEALSVLNGLLTCYLVVTGWVVVRRRPKEIRPIDYVLLLACVAIGVALMAFGIEAANSATGEKHGFPAAAYFVFGAVALTAAALDLRMILVGGVAGTHRIARHLWRMCFALFVAAASLFLGQPQVFPEQLQSTFVLAVPVLAVVVAGLYWLARVLISDQYKSHKI